MSQDTQYTLAFQDASTILLLPQTQPGCWEWGEGESGGDGRIWGRRFSCGGHVCLVVKTTLCAGHNCDHTAIPLGWGRDDADVRPTARGHPRGSWRREVDDEVGHRPGARQQVPQHGRGQVRGEAADLPEHRPEGMNHAVGHSGQERGVSDDMDADGHDVNMRDVFRCVHDVIGSNLPHCGPRCPPPRAIPAPPPPPPAPDIRRLAVGGRVGVGGVGVGSGCGLTRRGQCALPIPAARRRSSPR